jgi:hypothetical protein
MGCRRARGGAEVGDLGGRPRGLCSVGRPAGLAAVAVLAQQLAVLVLHLVEAEDGPRHHWAEAAEGAA